MSGPYTRPAAPEGPDTDLHNLRIENRLRPSFLVWVEGELRRRGINRITTEDSRLGQAGIDFPRGNDERRVTVWLGGRLDVGPRVRARLRLGLHEVRDVNNVRGEDETIFEGQLILDLRAPPVGFAVSPRS